MIASKFLGLLPLKKSASPHRSTFLTGMYACSCLILVEFFCFARSVDFRFVVFTSNQIKLNAMDFNILILCMNILIWYLAFHTLRPTSYVCAIHY